MKLTVKYDTNIDELNPIKFKVIKNFSLFCIKTFNIGDDEVNVILTAKKNPYGITTGGYDRGNGVYCRVEGRALPDILRTLAHEFTHYNQKLRGDFGIDDEVQDIGGIIEDEANAMSGRLVKMFVKDYNCRFIYEL